MSNLLIHPPYWLKLKGNVTYEGMAQGCLIPCRSTIWLFYYGEALVGVMVYYIVPVDIVSGFPFPAIP